EFVDVETAKQSGRGGFSEMIAALKADPSCRTILVEKTDRLADALERLRASSLESHSSVLAHHLYQAGAAADSQRTARFLAMAGRRAITAGAVGEALETFDHLISLELPDDNPLLAEAWEGRGKSLVALNRRDEASVALEQALSRYISRHDDGGIAR